jgi:hypothetical protein
MYTPFIRIILVIANIGLSIVFYSKEDYFTMSMTLLATLLFIYGYFRYGTVYAAFQQLKKENYNKAETLLLKIKKPNILSKGQKSYYHFIKGFIAIERKEWDTAISELNSALTIGLRTKNDESIALLNLANTEYELKNYKSAEAYIAKVREYNLKPLVKTEIDKLAIELNRITS